MNEIKKIVSKRIEEGIDISYSDNLFNYAFINTEELKEFINSSSDLEFYVISDIFSEIARLTQDIEFIELLKTRFIHISDNSLDLEYLKDLILNAESWVEAIDEEI